MRLASLFVLIACAVAHAQPTPRQRVLSDLEQLAKLSTIEARSVATLLGQPIDNTSVAPFRREYHFAASVVFATAYVVIGGKDDRWRIVSLEPAFSLRFDELAPLVIDLPVTTGPLSISDSPHLWAWTEYRFRVAAGDLVVRVDPDRWVKELILTTNRQVDAKAPTLRSRRSDAGTRSAPR